MPYVIYHKETTVLFNTVKYATEGAAKAEITRQVKKGKIIDREKYGIAEARDFFHNIEKQVTRRNLMSGKEFMIGVNTPSYMDPSMESYWSK